MSGGEIAEVARLRSENEGLVGGVVIDMSDVARRLRDAFPEIELIDGNAELARLREENERLKTENRNLKDDCAYRHSEMNRLKGKYEGEGARGLFALVDGAGFIRSQSNSRAAMESENEQYVPGLYRVITFREVRE